MAVFFWPASSSSVTIAASGNTGVTAPTSALEVGGINGSGNLTAITLDSSANLLTSVAASVLPTGAATSALQTTGNTSLASIAAGTPTSLGAKTTANSMAVNIASDQTVPVSASALPLPSGAATSALQTSGNASLTTLATNLPAQGQALAAASMPVVLPAAQITALTPPTTVAVTQATGSNLHTVLDSGSTTTVTQSTAGNLLAQVSQPTASSLNATVVQGTATNLLAQVSQPTASALNVTDATGVLAQGSVAAGTAGTKSVLTGLVYNSTPVSGLTNGQQVASQADLNGNLQVVQQDLMFTGQSAQTATINNIIPATAGAAGTNAQGFHSATIQINSTGTSGAYIFEGSQDNSTWITLPVWNQLILTGTPITAAVTVTATNIIYVFPITTQYIRVRISTIVAGGSIQAFTRLSQAAFAPPVRQVAQATAANLNVTAAIASAQTLATVSAVTAITNALPAGTNSIGLVGTTGSAGVANAPVQNIYSTTNITTATYVQLIASTTAATNYVDIFDSSGQAMVLSTGASGSEVILAYIPPGGDQIRVKIPAATRIAYKALSANATTGYLLLNLWQ